MPVPTTVAMAVVLLVHIPPVVASANVVVDPIHKLPPPAMASGAAFTVIILVTVQPVPSE
jgi:hypothetical protein